MSNYMGYDRRQNERKNYNLKSNPIGLKLKADDEVREIYKVHDVSISGMRISLAEVKLKTEQTLTLLVSERVYSLSVNAVVRWHAPGLESGIYEHGIEFDYGDMDLNLLLFMYLRENMNKL
ncbi:MAG: PilZ domain-containing protein [Gammaproteobacteria bacterium]|nr:PilZ domain-containing protein [Gammaproteobacteria bacterium]